VLGLICYVCGVIVVIRRVGVDMLRVWYNYCDTTCWGGHVTCGIIIVIQRVGVDMLRVWYSYCDTPLWGGHVTCVV
jgi:hypothetical protein